MDSSEYQSLREFAHSELFNDHWGSSVESYHLDIGICPEGLAEVVDRLNSETFIEGQE